MIFFLMQPIKIFHMRAPSNEKPIKQNKKHVKYVKYPPFHSEAEISEIRTDIGVPYVTVGLVVLVIVP